MKLKMERGGERGTNFSEVEGERGRTAPPPPVEVKGAVWAERRKKNRRR